MNTDFNANTQAATNAQTINNSSDLPHESAEALIKSMKDVVREYSGLEIRVKRETWPASGETLSMFVITLPREATPEQRAEADHWLNEIAPLFRYAD